MIVFAARSRFEPQFKLRFWVHLQTSVYPLDIPADRFKLDKSKDLP